MWRLLFSYLQELSITNCKLNPIIPKFYHNKGCQGYEILSSFSEVRGLKPIKMTFWLCFVLLPDFSPYKFLVANEALNQATVLGWISESICPQTVIIILSYLRYPSSAWFVIWLLKIL